MQILLIILTINDLTFSIFRIKYLSTYDICQVTDNKKYQTLILNFQ